MFIVHICISLEPFILTEHIIKCCSLVGKLKALSLSIYSFKELPATFSLLLDQQITPHKIVALQLLLTLNPLLFSPSLIVEEYVHWMPKSYSWEDNGKKFKDEMHYFLSLWPEICMGCSKRCGHTQHDECHQVSPFTLNL